MMKRTPPFSPEVRERAVRMVLEHQGEHDSQYGAIRSIGAKIGCSGETLPNWVVLPADWLATVKAWFQPVQPEPARSGASVH